MRWENIHWDKGLIFNPRGKSRKSRRYVPLTERVKVALLARKEGVNEGWIYPSKRAQSGYITDREVSKQWLEAKRLAGIPESVVLYCARHRFSTDAMEGTGNVMAVMDAMGHGSVNTTRIYCVHRGVMYSHCSKSLPVSRFLLESQHISFHDALLGGHGAATFKGGSSWNKPFRKTCNWANWSLTP